MALGNLGKFSDQVGNAEASQSVEGGGEPLTQLRSIEAEYGSLEGLTLYEKKCTIVNRALDEMGLGRYQWCIFALCGFGYFLDLLWAQAFGLILAPVEQEFGFLPSQSGNISTSFSAGLCAGAAFWGIMVDIVGRRWAFNLTVLITTVFGLGLAGANDYNTFLVLTAFIGLGVGGNIPIDTTITLEAIPQRHRRLLPLLSVFQPIGVVVTTALAYAFIPPYSCGQDPEGNDIPSCNTTPSATPCCSKENNFGWRYLILTIGSVTALIFILRFVVFRFRESPKYLLYRGHDEKAAAVLQSIAKFNRQSCRVTIETFESLESDDDSQGSGAAMLGGGVKQLQASWAQKFRMELERYKLLFENFQIARLTVLVWLIYACDYWGFTLAGTYVPYIVKAKNSDLGITIQETYRDYIYIYLPGIAAVLIAVYLYDLIRGGRQITMILSSTLMAVSLFIFATLNSPASNIGLNVMEYFFQTIFNAVLYGWTPEAFAAPIRGTACGIASFWGRLFSIVAPQAGASLLPDPNHASAEAFYKVLYLAGGVTLGCPLFLALLPRDLVGSESM